MTTKDVTQAWERIIDRRWEGFVERVPRIVDRARTGKARLAIRSLAFEPLACAIVAPERVRSDMAPLIPIVEQAIAEEQAELTDDDMVNIAVIDMLNLANVLSCVGCPIDQNVWSPVRGWLPRMNVRRDDERAHWFWTTKFAALALDQRRALQDTPALAIGAPIAFAPKQTFQFNLQAFLVHLAGAIEHRAPLDDVFPAWTDVLLNFEHMENAHSVDAGTLLWMARVVYHRIAGEPLGTVARNLHDALWNLAEER